MNIPLKIVTVTSLAMISVSGFGQPIWVPGTPAIASTGPLSVTVDYGIDRTGDVYIIIFNYENNSDLPSSYVRNTARSGPSGTIVATAALSVGRSNIGRILQRTLNVRDPQQIHTIYLVAANSRGELQSHPVRLTATTLPCPEADAGSGGEECDRNFTLNAIPKLETGTWTRISGPGNASFSPNAKVPDAIVTVTLYGTYVFRWTETQGVCSSADDITVTFSQPPNANAGTGGSVCGNEFGLNATPSIGVGTWVMTGGTGTASFSPGSHYPDAVVTVSEYGLKTFTWTETNGQCSDNSQVTVTFSEQPVADAGTGGDNCGLEMTLNATPVNGTGTWSRVSGPGNATFEPDTHTPDAAVTVTQYGTYIFRWTVQNERCSSSETISVSFFESLSANGGNGGDECDLNFQLTAVAGSGTGTWSQVGGPGVASFSPDTHRPDAIVTVTQYGSYDFAWREVNFNCSSVDVIRVNFHSPPPLSAGPDDALCRGNSIQLGATGTGTFRWTPPNLVNNPSIPDPVATPASTTLFTVTLTDQWGCINSDQVRIEVRDRPVSDAGHDQLLDYTFETFLNASAPKAGETGEWAVITGTGVFSEGENNNTLVTGLSLGLNSFVWTLNNTVCAGSSDTVNVMVNDLRLPSLVTPNQDGRNDFFFIKGIETFGKASLNIFNRWGIQVFSSDNYQNNWDGKDYNGKVLPEDTYFYQLKPENGNPVKGYIVVRY